MLYYNKSCYYLSIFKYIVYSGVLWCWSYITNISLVQQVLLLTWLFLILLVLELVPSPPPHSGDEGGGPVQSGQSITVLYPCRGGLLFCTWCTSACHHTVTV